MIRSSHRTAGPRRLLVLAIAALIPALAGCEAGNNAPTQSWHQPTDGTTKTQDDISINNVFVLGAPIGSVLQPGDSASVFLALYNDGSPDRLVGITAPGTATSVTLPGGGVSLGSQRGVFLTGPAPQVVLQGLLRPLTGGGTVRLVMSFQNAGRVSLVVPVMPQAQYYQTFTPAPSPTPSPTPATTSKHRGKARAGAKPGASPSP